MLFLGTFGEVHVQSILGGFIPFGSDYPGVILDSIAKNHTHMET